MQMYLVLLMGAIGLFAGLWLLVRALKRSSRKEGQMEVINESLKEEVNAQKKSSEVLLEHRTDSDTHKRLQSGDF